MITGRIVGSEIAKNRDGEIPVRLLQVEISDTEDVQTVELTLQSGETCNPPIDSNVCILEAGEAWLIGVAVDDGIGCNADILEGEREIYSSQLGVKKASAKFRQSGDIELNGNEDFLVRFFELEKAFNQLKADYNGHKHLGVTPGSSSTSVSDSISSADMDKAKIENLKVSKC